MKSIEIHKDALYAYTRRVAILWSLLFIAYFGLGLVALVWVWISKNRMRRWCYETNAVIVNGEIIITRHGFSKNVTHIPGPSINHITVITGPLMKKFGISNIQIGLGMLGARLQNITIPGIPSENVDEVIHSIKQIMRAK